MEQLCKAYFPHPPIILVALFPNLFQLFTIGFEVWLEDLDKLLRSLGLNAEVMPLPCFQVISPCLHIQGLCSPCTWGALLSW